MPEFPPSRSCTRKFSGARKYMVSELPGFAADAPSTANAATEAAEVDERAVGYEEPGIPQPATYATAEFE